MNQGSGLGECSLSGLPLVVGPHTIPVGNPHNKLSTPIIPSYYKYSWSWILRLIAADGG